MFAVSTTSQSTSSIATKVLSTVTLLMLVGVQGAHAASQRIFIATAAIPPQTAIRRCTNIAAQVGAAPIVSVNHLGLAQCDIDSPRSLTDAESERFGRAFVYGS
jgi:hypothetical protein